MTTEAKPIGSMRPQIGDVQVAWVDAVPAPLWARYGPTATPQDTEDIVVAWAENAGATHVRACWTGVGMFRVERA